MEKSNTILFVTCLIVAVSLLYASPTGWRNDAMVTDSVLQYVESCLTIDDSGRIHVATRQINQAQECFDLDYWRSLDNGVSWDKGNLGAIAFGQTEAPKRSTDITAVGDYVMIAYHEPSSLRFLKSTSAGDTWNDDIEIEGHTSNSRHPRIAVDGDSVHLIYAQKPSASDSFEIYHRCHKYSDNDTLWSNARRLTDAVRNSWHPAISVNAGAVHIVWADNRDFDTLNYDIYYNKSTDHCSTWVYGSTGHRLFRISDVSDFPDIVAYSDLNDTAVHVVWQDDRATKPGPGIYYCHSTDNGSSWENETLLCADGYHPSITADSFGLHVVFEKDSSIYYLESTDWGNTWQETLKITNTQYSNNSFPDFAVDDISNKHVVFVKKDPAIHNAPKIWYKQRDIVIPSSPYIANVEKPTSTNDVALTWGKITTDILGNAEAMDYYVVYRDTVPDFIPNSSDSISAVFHPDTTYTDSSVLDSSKNYYYLVMAVDEAKNKSEKSNMGYKLNKFVNHNTDRSSRNWVSLPWHSEYDTVSDLTDDLSPAGDPLESITNLRDDMVEETWQWDTDFMMWYGTDFAIEPGRGYEMVAIKDDTVVLVGSNDPDGLISLNHNTDRSSRNWVSIPYNAAYSTASDITTEYSPAGDPLESITNMRDDMVFQTWLYDTTLKMWSGPDFAIEPGRGYEFVPIKDTTWNPTEYSNEGRGLFIVEPPPPKPYVNMYLNMYMGNAIESPRAPVWLIDNFGDKLFNKELKKNINYHCADLYRLNTVTSKNTVDCRNNDSRVLVLETYKSKGEGEPRGDDDDERKISHVVRAYLDIEDFENFVFTAYRLNSPGDVLTEKTVSSVIMTNVDLGVLWFNVGNFETPWKDGEEVVLIIEATKQGKPYFHVENFKLNKKVDIEELGMISLKQMPAPGSQPPPEPWYKADNDNVIGYSLYKNDKRINEKVLQGDYSVSGDVSVRLVIRGGYETVYGSHQGSQSTPDTPIPIAYTFNIFPNLFGKRTRIDYALPKRAMVDVKIYDVSGKLVKTIVSERLDPGYYQVHWRGNDNLGRKVSSGVYFIQMNTKEYKSQQKVIFVR